MSTIKIGGSHTIVTGTTRPAPAWMLAIVRALGVTVAMWTIAFFSHLPIARGYPAIGAGAILLAAVLILARAAARDSGLFTPALAGLFAGIVNLLVLGSLVAAQAKPGLEGLKPGTPIVVVGFVFGMCVLGVIAGFIGRRMAGTPKRESATKPTMGEAFAALARVAAAAVVPLILIGGLVTSADAGMAVPDWPTSYTANMFLYPLSLMTGGVYLEHTHRLMGSLVGLTTLVLAAFAWMCTPRQRTRVRWAAIGLLVFVIVQGVLGGVRVTEDLRLLAMIHGITGQVFLALMTAYAAWVTPSFESVIPSVFERGRAARALSVAALVCLGVQLVFGAVLRHYSGMHAIVSHAAFAVIAAGACVLAGAACGRIAGQMTAGGVAGRVLRVSSKVLIHGVGLQVVLGLVALWAVMSQPKGEPATVVNVLVSTLHQLNGAILLASSALCAVWTRRIVAR